MTEREPEDREQAPKSSSPDTEFEQEHLIIPPTDADPAQSDTEPEQFLDFEYSLLRERRYGEQPKKKQPSPSEKSLPPIRGPSPGGKPADEPPADEPPADEPPADEPVEPRGEHVDSREDSADPRDRRSGF